MSTSPVEPGPEPAAAKQPQRPRRPVPGPAAAPPRSMPAVLAFVVGLVFCCPITSVVAVVLGVIGMRACAPGGVARRGRGFAVAGTVLGLWVLIRAGLAALGQMFGG